MLVSQTVFLVEAVIACFHWDSQEADFTVGSFTAHNLFEQLLLLCWLGNISNKVGEDKQIIL